MSLTNEIIESLAELSSSRKIQENEGFIVGSAILEGVDVEEVKKHVDDVLEKHKGGGELIVSELVSGSITDGGLLSFNILGGYVTEFYHYESTTSVFIRNYLISDGAKEWVAVYVDENPNTPWWDRD